MTKLTIYETIGIAVVFKSIIATPTNDALKKTKLVLTKQKPNRARKSSNVNPLCHSNHPSDKHIPQKQTRLYAVTQRQINLYIHG